MFGDDQFNPGKLEEEAAEYHNKESSPPLLLIMNVERHKPAGEIQQELKGLGNLVLSLSEKNWRLCK